MLADHLERVLDNIARTDPNDLRKLNLPEVFRQFKARRAEDKVIVLAKLYGRIPEDSALRPFILGYTANLQKNDGQLHKSAFILKLLEAMRNRYYLVTDEFLDSVIALVPRPPKIPKKGKKGISRPIRISKKPPS